MKIREALHTCDKAMDIFRPIIPPNQKWSLNIKIDELPGEKISSPK